MWAGKIGGGKEEIEYPFLTRYDFSLLLVLLLSFLLHLALGRRSRVVRVSHTPAGSRWRTGRRERV